jgi:RNA polymerase sigma-70 factor (ECF subfamily)
MVMNEAIGAERLATFERQRPKLFGIAYRMLGSVMDAEDVVQDALVRWLQLPDVSSIESPDAYLATMVSRRGIDVLRSARVTREQYIGPWLPEPLVTDPAADPAEAGVLADSLSTAFLVLLETLSPTERAAFLLREVFGYDYPEVARIVGVGEANARKLVQRARERIEARRPRFEATPEQHARLLDEFMRATTRGDLDGLVGLLAADVTMYADGGGKVTAARNPIGGAERVARFLIGIAPNMLPGSMRVLTLNGRAAVAAYDGERRLFVLTLDVADDRIRGVYVTANPDKLRAVEQQAGM